jgi:hypothetical protein
VEERESRRPADLHRGLWDVGRAPIGDAVVDSEVVPGERLLERR